MAKNKMDAGAALKGIAGQFQGLDTNNPGSWPILPRILALIVITIAVVVVLWYGLVSGEKEVLQQSIEKEDKLKAEFTTKVKKAVALDELKAQREQVQQYVSLLEKQLPSKAEMDALLSDINQAGLGRSLQFELFKPGSLNVKDYYAELPIQLKVIGNYHDMGAFASDIAHLSRIVTLNDVKITQQQASDKAPSSTLVMDATVKTFRYLDPDEQEIAQSANKKAGGK